MKAHRLEGMIGIFILGVCIAYSAAPVTAAAPETKAFKSKELVFESDGKQAGEDRSKAHQEKRVKEKAPLTEEEKKQRRQESISKRYQGMIQQQEAIVARWMKIRGVAQQERALLTIKEIDALITEQREQIKATKQQMQDALHPEQARLRRLAEKKKLMEVRRAQYEAEKERNPNSKAPKRERQERKKVEE